MSYAQTACNWVIDNALEQYQITVLDWTNSDVITNPSVLLSEYTDPTVALWDGHIPTTVEFSWILVDGVCHPVDPLVTFPAPSVATCQTLEWVLLDPNYSWWNPPYTYEWSNGLTTQTISAAWPEVTYTITATDEMGCLGDASIDVNIPAMPGTTLEWMGLFCLDDGTAWWWTVTLGSLDGVDSFERWHDPFETATVLEEVDWDYYLVNLTYWSQMWLECLMDINVELDMPAECSEPFDCSWFEVVLDEAVLACGETKWEIEVSFTPPVSWDDETLYILSVDGSQIWQSYSYSDFPIIIDWDVWWWEIIIEVLGADPSCEISANYDLTAPSAQDCEACDGFAITIDGEITNNNTCSEDLGSVTLLVSWWNAEDWSTVTLSSWDSSSLANGSTSFALSNLPNGTTTYTATVSVTDENNDTVECNDEVSVEITWPEEPSITLNTNSVTVICGEDSASLQVNDGQAWWTYARENSAGDSVWWWESFEATITDTYTVTVTDENWCESNSAQADVLMNNNCDCTLDIDVSSTQITCDADGQYIPWTMNVSRSVTNDQTDVVVERNDPSLVWANQSFVTPGTLIPTVTYTENGQECVSPWISEQFILPVCLTECGYAENMILSQNVITSATWENWTCDANGSIEFWEVIGAIGDAQIIVDGIEYSEGDIVEWLSDGFYTYAIQDDNGCEWEVTLEVECETTSSWCDALKLPTPIVGGDDCSTWDPEGSVTIDLGGVQWWAEITIYDGNWNPVYGWDWSSTNADEFTIAIFEWWETYTFDVVPWSEWQCAAEWEFTIPPCPESFVWLECLEDYDNITVYNESYSIIPGPHLCPEGTEFDEDSFDADDDTPSWEVTSRSWGCIDEEDPTNSVWCWVTKIRCGDEEVQEEGEDGLLNTSDDEECEPAVDANCNSECKAELFECIIDDNDPDPYNNNPLNFEPDVVYCKDTTDDPWDQENLTETDRYRDKVEEWWCEPNNRCQWYVPGACGILHMTDQALFSKRQYPEGQPWCMHDENIDAPISRAWAWNFQIQASTTFPLKTTWECPENPWGTYADTELVECELDIYPTPVCDDLNLEFKENNLLTNWVVPEWTTVDISFDESGTSLGVVDWTADVIQNWVTTNNSSLVTYEDEWVYVVKIEMTATIWSDEITMICPKPLIVWDPDITDVIELWEDENEWDHCWAVDGMTINYTEQAIQLVFAWWLEWFCEKDFDPVITFDQENLEYAWTCPNMERWDYCTLNVTQETVECDDAWISYGWINEPEMTIDLWSTFSVNWIPEPGYIVSWKNVQSIAWNANIWSNGHTERIQSWVYESEDQIVVEWTVEDTLWSSANCTQVLEVVAQPDECWDNARVFTVQEDAYDGIAEQDYCTSGDGLSNVASFPNPWSTETWSCGDVECEAYRETEDTVCGWIAQNWIVSNFFNGWDTPTYKPAYCDEPSTGYDDMNMNSFQKTSTWWSWECENKLTEEVQTCEVKQVISASCGLPAIVYSPWDFIGGTIEQIDVSMLWDVTIDEIIYPWGTSNSSWRVPETYEVITDYIRVHISNNTGWSELCSYPIRIYPTLIVDDENKWNWWALWSRAGNTEEYQYFLWNNDHDDDWIPNHLDPDYQAQAISQTHQVAAESMQAIQVLELLTVVDVDTWKTTEELEVMREVIDSWCKYKDGHEYQSNNFVDIWWDLEDTVNKLNEKICLTNWTSDTSKYFQPNRETTLAETFKLFARTLMLDRNDFHETAIEYEESWRHRWEVYLEALEDEFDTWYWEFNLTRTELDSPVDMRTALMLLVTVVDHHVEQIDNQKILELYQAIEVYEGQEFLRSDAIYLMEFMYDYLLEVKPSVLHTPLAYIWHAEQVGTQEAILHAQNSYDEDASKWNIATENQSYREDNLQSIQ